MRTLLAVTTAAILVAGCGSSAVTRTVTSSATAIEANPQTSVAGSDTTIDTWSHPPRHHHPRPKPVAAAPATTSTAAAPAFASGYPTSFESSFTVECLQTSGGNTSGCSCVLRHIEASVPYSTAIASEHAIAIGQLPAWYTGAAAACRG